MFGFGGEGIFLGIVEQCVCMVVSVRGDESGSYLQQLNVRSIIGKEKQ